MIAGTPIVKLANSTYGGGHRGTAMGIMLTECGRKSSPSEYAEKLGISRCGLWVKVLVVVTCPARFVYEKNAIFIFDISLIVDLLPLTLSPQNDISFPWLLSLLLTVASNSQCDTLPNKKLQLSNHNPKHNQFQQKQQQFQVQWPVATSTMSKNNPQPVPLLNVHQKQEVIRHADRPRDELSVMFKCSCVGRTVFFEFGDWNCVYVWFFCCTHVFSYLLVIRWIYYTTMSRLILSWSTEKSMDPTDPKILRVGRKWENKEEKKEKRKKPRKEKVESCGMFKGETPTIKHYYHRK